MDPDIALEQRHCNNILWFFVAHSLVFAVGILIYWKWDESLSGAWYPRGLFVEVAMFLIILLS